MTDQYPQNNPHQPQPPQPDPAPDPSKASHVASIPEATTPENPVTDALQDAPQITPLDPTKLRAQRAAEAKGKPFTLRNTPDASHPTTVLAKRPDILDTDNLKLLPDNLQRAVMDMINDAATAEGDTPDEPEDELAVMVENFGDAGAMARIYCIYGFIEPRCYATVDEAVMQGGVWVDDIAETDRFAFMGHCMGTIREVTQPVETFRPGSDPDVGTGPDGGAVSGAGQSEPRPVDSGADDPAGVDAG